MSVNNIREILGYYNDDQGTSVTRIELKTENSIVPSFIRVFGCLFNSTKPVIFSVDGRQNKIETTK